MTTLLNVFTVAPANQTPLLDLLRTNTDTVVRTLDGWISTDLIASADGTRVVIHSRWRDADSIQAMRRDARMVAYFPRIAALATHESILGDVAHAAAIAPVDGELQPAGGRG
jgi:quinol monooxygenase YgiN